MRVSFERSKLNITLIIFSFLFMIFFSLYLGLAKTEEKIEKSKKIDYGEIFSSLDEELEEKNE